MLVVPVMLSLLVIFSLLIQVGTRSQNAGNCTRTVRVKSRRIARIGVDEAKRTVATQQQQILAAFQ